MGQQSTDMDLRAIVKELEAKKRQMNQEIDKEIEAVHIAIRLNQERTKGGDTGGRRSSTYAQELTDAIYDALSSERPLHRTVILERITERGIHVGGTKPINSIGSYLSTDRRFKNCGRGMWTLEEDRITGTPTSDDAAADMTNARPQGVSLGNGGIFASMEEDFAVHSFKQEGEYDSR